MIVWKVVRKKDRGSCLLTKENPYYRIYEKGKKVTGKDGTPLFAFRTKKQAEDYIDGAIKQEIVLKCEAEESAEHRNITKIFGFPQGRWERITEFWEDVDFFLDYYTENNSTEGAVLCSSITPLE